MGRGVHGDTVLCPLQATLNPHPQLFLGVRVWPWAGCGSLYCACPGGAAACLNHKRMGRCAGLRPADQGPESTGKRKQGGGRRAGARAEEEVGWGRGKSQPQPRDSLGCSRALFGSPAPREARPRPRGPWLRSLVNGRELKWEIFS